MTVWSKSNRSNTSCIRNVDVVLFANVGSDNRSFGDRLAIRNGADFFSLSSLMLLLLWWMISIDAAVVVEAWRKGSYCCGCNNSSEFHQSSSGYDSMLSLLPLYSGKLSHSHDNVGVIDSWSEEGTELVVEAFGAAVVGITPLFSSRCTIGRLQIWSRLKFVVHINNSNCLFA